MSRVCLITSLVLLFGAFHLSPAELAPGAGTDASVSMGLSGRASSLADAGGALYGDALSVFYNPAAPALLKRTEIDLHYNHPFADVTDCDRQALALGFPLIFEVGLPGMSSSLGTISLSLARFHVGGIPETNYEGPTGREFGETTLLSQISYATKVGRMASFGLSLKTLSHKVDNRSGGGFGADLGFLWNPRNLSLGIAVVNALAPEVKLGNKGDSPHTRFRLGVAYQPIPLINLIIDGETDGNLSYDGAFATEILPFADYNNLVVLRGGYRLSTETWSAGLGLDLGAPFLDMAYSNHVELGSGESATFGWRIPPAPPKPKVVDDGADLNGDNGSNGVETIDGSDGTVVPGGDKDKTTVPGGN